MKDKIMRSYKAIQDGPSLTFLRKLFFIFLALFRYPKNKLDYFRSRTKRKELLIDADITNSTSRRIFNYNFHLLPTSYIAEIESRSPDLDFAVKNTGLTIGYPAWNLLYYSLLTSLLPIRNEIIIVETGTNLGFSTIILAQALKDTNAKGFIYTVDIDQGIVERAKRNIEYAGLDMYVRFHVQDSVEFLSNFVNQTEYIDFAFLDSNHCYEHVKKEFSIIFPRIVACKGKVYFDNTAIGDVQKAIQYIKFAYGGNFIEFRNCSWSPCGNTIWQPD
jgi:predicted O-methyltransferase YrrM